jgi:hypothetical protein
MRLAYVDIPLQGMFNWTVHAGLSPYLVPCSVRGGGGGGRYYWFYISRYWTAYPSREHEEPKKKGKLRAGGEGIALNL